MDDASYVYVLVREDLTWEQQAVQACHASLHAGYSEQEPSSPPNLVLLTVPSEQALLNASHLLDLKGVEYSIFNEPDGSMGYSALATKIVRSRTDRQIFSKFPLLRRVTTLSA